MVKGDWEINEVDEVIQNPSNYWDQSQQTKTAQKNVCKGSK